MRADHLDSYADDQSDGLARGSDEPVPGGGEAGDGAEAARVREAPNLLDLLRSRVRAASDGRLALSASLGVAGLVTMGVARRWPWPAIALCSALCGAGLWGILDRTRSAPAASVHAPPASPTPLVTAARVTAGAIALISLLALLLGAFGLCLGTWIS